MSESTTQYGAAAAAAGYLYQARLALLLCIPHLNTGADIEVTIEAIDDVAFSSDGSAFERLQSKHHIRRQASLTDASVDLWKTLRIWSEAAFSDPSLPSRVKLVLLTTGIVPAGSAAAYLKPIASYGPGAKRDPAAARDLLVQVAEKSTNRDLKPAFEAFLALSEPMRASLLSAIEIVDGQPLLAEVESELERGLRLAAPAGKAAAARELLEGWWWPQVCGALLSEPPTGIPIGAVEAKLDDVRDSLKRNALVADMEHAEPGDAELSEMDGFRFVKQLALVGVGGNRLRFAKRDYYRAYSQRSKWLREHVVLDEELDVFEKRLIEEWEPRFEAMRDSHVGDEANEGRLKQDGQELYYWVETEARFPFRSLTSRFLNVGSYHMLADRRLVGWHRDYTTLTETS